jgi:glucose-6-phosphate dehydrogenase assembly protein OpcA
MTRVPVTDVPAILEELGRARAAASENGTSPCNAAATMNLVVFVDDPDYREWVLTHAQGVAEKHPSRLVIIDRTRDDGGADVGLLTREGAVCVERVDLAIGGLEPPVIRAIVHDLTAPGIPTVFWWSSSRVLADSVLNALSGFATTLVVDSSGSVSGEETIHELAAFLCHDDTLVVRDLAFMRLAPWQDMIAQFFDDRALFDDLFSLTRLEIVAGSEAEALYLAGWLGSRLSWKAADAHTFRAPDGHTIGFAREARGGRRRVLRVTLASAGSTYSAELTDDANVARLTVDGANAKPSWCVPLQNIDNLSLIERSVLMAGHDQIFETSLQTVGDMLG